MLKRLKVKARLSVAPGKIGKLQSFFLLKVLKLKPELLLLLTLAQLGWSDPLEGLKLIVIASLKGSGCGGSQVGRVIGAGIRVPGSIPRRKKV